MDVTVSELAQLFVKHRPEKESPGARWNLAFDSARKMPHSVDLLLRDAYSSDPIVVVRESYGLETRGVEIPLAVLLDLWPTIAGLLHRLAAVREEPAPGSPR